MEKQLQELVHDRLRDLLEREESPLSSQEKAQIVQQIGDSILGLGPLEPFLRSSRAAGGRPWPSPHPSS